MQKKLTFSIESTNPHINIEGLNGRFDPICIFDSNETLNNNKHTHSSKLIAIGSTQELYLKESDTAINLLQQFYNSKKGWLFGYLTYELKNSIECLSSGKTDKLDFPLLHFFSPKIVLEIKKKNVSVFYDDENTSEKEAIEIYHFCFAENSEEKESSIKKITLQARITKDEYTNSIKKLKEHIRKGDIYEINFCQEFFAENTILDTVDVYRKLDAISGAPFSAYCKFGALHLMCASPERFLQKLSNKLISQPIKGTIKRSTIEVEDEQLKSSLLNNVKERSENVMIVDLVRNDLSRIAKKGSVKVEELFGIYSFKQVHQMISTISCELSNERTFTEIISSTFPMGSMTGAPKISAMKLIDKYESTKRGLYSGTIGYITPEGDFDFNVIIRSILYNSQNNYLSFMVGSAITDKSIVEKEYEECLLKAKAMFEALSANFQSIHNTNQKP